MFDVRWMGSILQDAAWLFAAAGIGIVLSWLRDLSLRPRERSRATHGDTAGSFARQRQRRVLPLTIVLLGSLAVGARVHAEDRPAATLLLPYFEAELPVAPGAPVQGPTTWLTIASASDDATLTRVVVWSDLAVPVYGFNVYLKAFDVQRIDLQQVLIGKIPQTNGADAQGCSGALPPPLPSAAKVAELQALLTGKPSPADGKCAGFDHGERIARGYVTVDVVNQCSSQATSPSDPGYFAGGGTGVAANANAISGSAFMLDGTKKTSFAVPVAHLPVPKVAIEQGLQTFYGRYVGKTAIDGREPLSNQFAVPYYDGAEHPLAPRATSVLVWRDTRSPLAARFTCGTKPAWYPLALAKVVAFDDTGAMQEIPTTPSPLPLAAGRARLGSSDLPLPFDEGWLFLNLEIEEPKLEDPQSFVTVLYRNRGQARTAAPALRFVLFQEPS